MSKSRDNKTKSKLIRGTRDWLPEVLHVLMYIPRLLMGLIRGIA